MRGLLLGLTLFAAAGLAQAQEPPPPNPDPPAQPAPTPDASPRAGARQALEAFYALPSAPRTGLDQHLAPDLAEALERDLAQRQPTVSSDYRFDLPERPSGALSFSEAPTERDAGFIVEFDGSRVLVEMCRRRDGQWRVTDIRDPDEFWGTRAYLLLPGGHVRCDR